MLTLVTTALRARAAGLLAIVYLICVMSPALTLALGSGRNAACLLQEYHSSGTVHVHPVQSTGVHHVDADPAQQESRGTTSASADELSEGDTDSDDKHERRNNRSCGMSYVSALPAAIAVVGYPAVPTTTHQALVVQVLGNKPSKPLYRPPIA